jgi:hypothetical protein
MTGVEVAGTGLHPAGRQADLPAAPAGVVAREPLADKPSAPAEMPDARGSQGPGAPADGQGAPVSRAPGARADISSPPAGEGPGAATRRSR